MFGAFAALTEAAPLLAGARESAERPASVRIVTDPGEVVVVFDRGVVRIDQDHLEPLLGTVFADPVAIEHAEVAVLPGGTLFSDALEVLSPRDPVDALAFRPATLPKTALSRRALSDADPGEDNALFGLVAERPSLIEPGRALDPLDRALATPLLGALPLEFVVHVIATVLPRFPDV